MAAHRITRTTIIAIMVATTAALVARAWLRVQLREDGMQAALAADLSYLVVPPILLLLLFPLWRKEKIFLRQQFRRQDLSWRIALTAIAIGFLLRLLWWSQLIAGVSFGVYMSSNPNAVVGPVLSFQCGSPGVVLLGFLVMALLVPLIEEIVHRGYIQTTLMHRGLVVSALASALVFMVFHKFAAWPFAFFTGAIFAIQYWSTRSLWPSLISHAVVNGLIQLDWRCMSGQWNPRPGDLPLMTPGIIATVVFVACLIALTVLLRRMLTGASRTPR